MRGAPQSGFSTLIRRINAQHRLEPRSPSLWTRLPTPVAAKSGSVPTHERLGPNDGENLQDCWKPAIQLDKEPSIKVRELNAATRPPPQDNQLMSQRRILGFKPQLDLNGEARTHRAKRNSPIIPPA
jgi:hypothetical protein